MATTEERPICCSFCGRQESQVRLIAGPGVYICSECVQTCCELLQEDAHTMQATKAQIGEDIQDEIQELKTAIKWVGDQLIDIQNQVMLKCDWNSTQFCVTPVHFNNSA